MSKQKKKPRSLTPAEILSYGFGIIIIIGAFLLYMPISSVNGRRLDIVNAFFTATSATCVTGLAVVDTGTHFTLFGQIVILSLTQLGGLGFMTFGTLIALALNRRITLKDRLVLQEAINYNSMDGLLMLIRRVVLYTVTIEGIGALLLSARWAMEMPLGKAIYFGIFHSISVFNNGGFDLFGSHYDASGFSNFRNDPFINIVIMLLIFLGGIGFIVIHDLLQFPKSKKLSLHSKIVLTMSACLIAIGALVIFVIEIFNPATLGELPLGKQITASFFHSISSRSGGVSTVDVSAMQHSTQFFLVLLMFIGAAPGSTGGGIKVTVFAILLGAVYSMIRGKQDIVFFKKRLPQESILRAITQTLMSLFLVISAAMALSALEDREFLPLLFETTSAFATTGLSLDLTPRLTTISKIILCFVMFIGRIGPLTLAYAIRPKPKKDLIRYPEGKITIG
ncbi:TrkH family potassium uptake protein [Paenibacillus aceti]|uniref:K+ transporter Trk n=1 Tax=Paenibacillus aceti TaxID=1820010 RepID=A0ABQ1VSR3_9BACL|nr:TrkH family potassium uptake protein [Paenibacillus aceti]GGF94949.1 K+ transporter Trk [Paenibacillus aceti]